MVTLLYQVISQSNQTFTLTCGGRSGWGGGGLTTLLSTDASPFSLTVSLASAISLSEAVMRTLHLLVVVVAVDGL